MKVENRTLARGVISTLILLALLLAAGGLVDLAGLAHVSWPAFLAMMGFYAVIFLLAVVAGQRRQGDHLLAHKSLPLWLATFTMSATWVGGGFINGTAEYTYSAGLVWVQAPWGYAFSLILGGLIFAAPMRRRGYTTMLDPLQERFGRRTNVLFYLPALMGDVFWTAAILVALGTTFGTILGLDAQLSIVLSALVVIIYTSLGGLWSVAVTDVAQLTILLLGLTMVVWVVYSGALGWSEAWQIYRQKMGASASWLPSQEALGLQRAVWWDSALLLMLGGIPWQVYFQRVLAAKSVKVAVGLSVFSGFVCLLAALPAVAVGVAAVATDWSAMGLGGPADAAFTLPYVVHHLTSPWIATLGLGAIAAAVMSSADSSILSAASLTAWNLLPQTGEVERQRLLKKVIWIIGIATMLIALQVQSIYALWVLCSDFVYCLLFPALVTALFDKRANHYGAIAGFGIALFLRLGGGEPVFALEPWLPYPREAGVITVPFKTIAMLTNLATIMLVSRLVAIFSSKEWK